MIDQLRGGRDRRPGIEAVGLSRMESLGVGPSRFNACQARCLMVIVRTGPGTVGFDSQPFMLKPCRIASSRRCLVASPESGNLTLRTKLRATKSSFLGVELSCHVSPRGLRS